MLIERNFPEKSSKAENSERKNLYIIWHQQVCRDDHLLDPGLLQHRHRALIRQPSGAVPRQVSSGHYNHHLTSVGRFDIGLK